MTRMLTAPSSHNLVERRTLFGHREFQVAPEDSVCFLGPSQDGHYVFSKSDSEQITAVAQSRIRLRPQAARAATEAAQCLFDATGEVMRFNSGYRTLVDQLRVFRSYLIKSEDFRRTIRQAAPPGYSEHHTGLAIDLQDHVADAKGLLPFFGWEMSFPKNNAQGIRYEPWHWRFVGISAIRNALADHALAGSPYVSNGRENFLEYAQNGLSLTSPSVLSHTSPATDPSLLIAEYLLELGKCIPDLSPYNYKRELLQQGLAWLESSGIGGIDDQDALLLAIETLLSLLPGDRSERVRNLQRQLARLGVFRDVATGFYGPKTANAVRDCCGLLGRADTGYVDIDLLRRLRERTTTALEMTPSDRIAEIVRGKWLGGTSWQCGLTFLGNGRYPGTLRDGELRVASCVTQRWDTTADCLAAIDDHANGALLVDTEQLPESLPVPVLKVARTRLAVTMLAQHARSLLKGKVIAITGSSGKTTTKEVLRDVLAHYGVALATPGSANTLMAVCYQLLNWITRADFYVCECGLGATGSSIDQQSHLLRPHVAIVTSVHAAHAEGYQSVEQIARKKVEMAKSLEPGGHLFLDGDSDHLQLMTEAARDFGVENFVTFGVGEKCSARVVDYQAEGTRGSARLSIFGKRCDVRLKMLGKHWAKMAAVVLGCCDLFSCDLGKAVAKLEEVSLPKGRGAVSGRLGQSLVLFDSHYNANPGSMCADLEAFAQIRVPDSVRKVAVIGSMKELGTLSPELHRQIIPAVVAAGFSRIYLVGEEASELADALKYCSVTSHATADEVVDRLKKELLGNECVFVKGSHSNELEKVARYLNERIEITLRQQ